MFPVLLLQASPPGSPTVVTIPARASAGRPDALPTPVAGSTADIGLLCAIIVGAGLLGGYLNYLRTRTTPVPNPPADYRPLATAGDRYGLLCLVGGVVAAAMVPLFLQTIQSGLLQNNVTGNSYLVFGGLCLLAAVFSNTFMDTLSKRVFDVEQKADLAERKAITAQTAAGVVISATTDTDEPAPAGPSMRSLSTKEQLIESVPADASLSPEAGQVLASLRNGRSPFYSAEALARRTQTDVATARTALTELVQQAYVLAVPNGETTVYALNRGAATGAAT